MKSKIGVIGLFILMTIAVKAQTKITFKGEELIIAGQSAGKIKGLDYNPSEYESFYKIDKKNKLITFSNIQTFGLDDNAANNIDFETFKIPFSSIASEYFPERPTPDATSFGVTVYEVAISCKGFEECIDFQYNYRFSPSRELIKGTNNISMKVYFLSELEANEFIKSLKKAVKS
jgi:hypothetical protein